MDTAEQTATVTDDKAKEREARQDELAARRKDRRLVLFLLKGQVDENSALLPTDKWAKEAVWDFAKKSKSLHKNAGGLFGFAAGALAVVGAGIAGAVAVAALAPVAAIAAVTLGVSGFFAKKAYDFFGRLKGETLAELRTDIGKKYIELKMSEIKAAFEKKKEELARKRAAEKALKDAEPKPAVAPAAEVKPAVEARPADPAAPKPANDPVGTVGGWLLKKAMEAAAKKKDKDAAPPANDTPAAPATDKKTPPPPKAA